MRTATGARTPITTASHTSRGMTGTVNAPMYARCATRNAARPARNRSAGSMRKTSPRSEKASAASSHGEGWPQPAETSSARSVAGLATYSTGRTLRDTASQSRSAKTPKATSAMASITLDLEEDGAGRGARRARDRRGVEGDLTPVLAEAARDLDVGLEVDDGPDPVLQERRVDHPFDHDAVVEPDGNRRLAPAGPGAGRAADERVGERADHRPGRGRRLLRRRPEETALERRHARHLLGPGVEVDHRQHGMYQRSEALAVRTGPVGRDGLDGHVGRRVERRHRGLLGRGHDAQAREARRRAHLGARRLPGVVPPDPRLGS